MLNASLELNAAAQEAIGSASKPDWTFDCMYAGALLNQVRNQVLEQARYVASEPDPRHVLLACTRACSMTPLLQGV